MGVVVAAAILRSGRVLAAHRTGRGWEFPGGKVEPGETEPQALARECREELDADVAVGALLGSSRISPSWTLHLYACTLLAGEPQPLTDHDSLRWLSPDALDALDWLAPDRPLLPSVRALLAGGPAPIVVRRLISQDLDTLTSLLDSAPDYTHRAVGRSPAPGDASAVLEGRPASVERTDKFGFGMWLGLQLIAFADVLRGYPSAEIAYLGLLIVHPDHRRQGRGRALHTALEGELRAGPGVRRLRLSIVATNAAGARPFWRALGYAPTGETKPFVREDGLETEVEFWERPLAWCR